MKSIVNKAIEIAQKSELAFTKFIMPNDTGATGGHQAGFHIHKIHGVYFLIRKVQKEKTKTLLLL